MEEAFTNSSDLVLENQEGLDIFAGFDQAEPTASEMPAETQGQESIQEEAAAAQDTTQAETPAPEPETAPTTEQEPETGDDSLTFSAKINHQEQSVTLSKDELPTIYQKAQNMDRAVQRAQEAKQELERYKGMVDKAMGLARVMEFTGDTPEATIEAMVSGISESAKQSKVSAMVAAGTQQDVAEYIVNQQMKDARDSVAEAGGTEESTAAEDTADTMSPPTSQQFSADLQKLFDKRPDLRNSRDPFPESVLTAYMGGENLTAAYLEYEAAQNAQELQELRKQTKVYQQNQEAARKAPIKSGVSGSGTGKDQEDPMLQGFDDPYW